VLLLELPAVSAFVNDRIRNRALATSPHSFVDVLRDIGSNISSLLRFELRLADAEIRKELNRARRGALICLAAGAAGLLSIVFFLLAIEFALSQVMPDWAAALIIGAVMGLGAAALLVTGTRRLQPRDGIMPKTRQTLQEDGHWAKQQIR
jgi:protein-S-isoprenylcysteine O-methyltransferase Ste14